ncbi:type I-E CRISPR-associated protein Cse1/CasA [Streptomyces sp. CAU 1734]|uniref:type I-E CRISPR-associated protein Cse1/CasA n=1 Tax=Streptomyces sp. CAU 1734 TaxID=3140360 RepID=UPI0032603F18
MTSDARSWHAGRRPWIEVMDARGRRRVLSTGEVLRHAGRVYLAAADALVRSATVRLLTAIACAAGCAPGDGEEYARRVRDGVDLRPAAAWAESGDHLDLFHPVRPWFQDASLAPLAEAAGQPVLYLDPSAAVGRPLLSDRRHLHTSCPVPPARAARLLLVQQMWCLGGRLAGSQKDFGPGANFGSPAPACGHAVWQPDGTAAEILAWSLVPLPGGPGTGQWTWRVRGGAEQRLIPDGELDALTWHPRRILLLPDGPAGQVGRILVCQGWRQPAATDTTGHATRHLAPRDDGKPLNAQAVTGDDDVAPLLDAWWGAPAGNWAHTVRETARETGCAPRVVVTALAVDKKKTEFQRQIRLPSDALTDGRVRPAARAVMGWRQALWERGPGRGENAATGLQTPPAAGSHLLTDEGFLSASPDGRARTLARLATPPPGGDPVLHARRCGSAARLTPTPPAPDPPAPSPAADPVAAPDEELTLFPLPHPGDKPPAQPAAWDDEDLFTTAATARPHPAHHTDPADADAVDDGEEDSGIILARHLGRWANAPGRRDTLTALARYALDPSPHSPARHQVTRLVPSGEHDAAMLTAALFAYHRARARPGTPLYGGAPLPRLLRAATAAGGYGPGSGELRFLIERLARTTDPDAARPHLIRVLRLTAEQGMTPSWPALHRDLADWTETTRARWTRLFHTTSPI